jgi:hypothetical protein
MMLAERDKIHVAQIDNALANEIVEREHYLHRKIYLGRNISYGVTYDDIDGLGVLMFGYPVFHTKKYLVGPEEPLRNGELVELCRVWLPDAFPSNSETAAIGKAIKFLRKDWPELHNDGERRWLPVPRAIISLADTEFTHQGTIYLAANFKYLGWVHGRKAVPGHGQGRWANAHREGTGQIKGVRKNVYLLVLDHTLRIDLDKLRQTYGGNNEIDIGI